MKVKKEIIKYSLIFSVLLCTLYAVEFVNNMRLYQLIGKVVFYITQILAFLVLGHFFKNKEKI